MNPSGIESDPQKAEEIDGDRKSNHSSFIDNLSLNEINKNDITFGGENNEYKGDFADSRIEKAGNDILNEKEDKYEELKIPDRKLDRNPTAEKNVPILNLLEQKEKNILNSDFEEGDDNSGEKEERYFHDEANVGIEEHKNPSEGKKSRGGGNQEPIENNEFGNQSISEISLNFDIKKEGADKEEEKEEKPPILNQMKELLNPPNEKMMKKNETHESNMDESREDNSEYKFIMNMTLDQVQISEDEHNNSKGKHKNRESEHEIEEAKFSYSSDNQMLHNYSSPNISVSNITLGVVQEEDIGGPSNTLKIFERVMPPLDNVILEESSEQNLTSSIPFKKLPEGQNKKIEAESKQKEEKFDENFLPEGSTGKNENERGELKSEEPVVEEEKVGDIREQEIPEINLYQGQFFTNFGKSANQYQKNERTEVSDEQGKDDILTQSILATEDEKNNQSSQYYDCFPANDESSMSNFKPLLESKISKRNEDNNFDDSIINDLMDGNEIEDKRENKFDSKSFNQETKLALQSGNESEEKFQKEQFEEKKLENERAYDNTRDTRKDEHHPQGELSFSRFKKAEREGQLEQSKREEEEEGEDLDGDEQKGLNREEIFQNDSKEGTNRNETNFLSFEENKAKLVDVAHISVEASGMEKSMLIDKSKQQLENPVQEEEKFDSSLYPDMNEPQTHNLDSRNAKPPYPQGDKNLETVKIYESEIFERESNDMQTRKNNLEEKEYSGSPHMLELSEAKERLDNDKIPLEKYEMSCSDNEMSNRENEMSCNRENEMSNRDEMSNRKERSSRENEKGYRENEKSYRENEISYRENEIGYRENGTSAKKSKHEEEGDNFREDSDKGKTEAHQIDYSNKMEGNFSDKGYNINSVDSPYKFDFGEIMNEKDNKYLKHLKNCSPLRTTPVIKSDDIKVGFLGTQEKKIGFKDILNNINENLSALPKKDGSISFSQNIKSFNSDTKESQTKINKNQPVSSFQAKRNLFFLVEFHKWLEIRQNEGGKLFSEDDIMREITEVLFSLKKDIKTLSDQAFPYQDESESIKFLKQNYQPLIDKYFEATNEIFDRNEVLSKKIKEVNDLLKRKQADLTENSLRNTDKIKKNMEAHKRNREEKTKLEKQRIELDEKLKKQLIFFEERKKLNEQIGDKCKILDGLLKELINLEAYQAEKEKELSDLILSLENTEKETQNYENRKRELDLRLPQKTAEKDAIQTNIKSKEREFFSQRQQLEIMEGNFSDLKERNNKLNDKLVSLDLLINENYDIVSQLESQRKELNNEMKPDKALTPFKRKEVDVFKAIIEDDIHKQKVLQRAHREIIGTLKEEQVFNDKSKTQCTGIESENKELINIRKKKNQKNDEYYEKMREISSCKYQGILFGISIGMIVFFLVCGFGKLLFRSK